jgi:branched-chain amino acid transport system permease protein
VIAPETGVFKTSYRADLTLHRVPFARYAMLAGLVALYVVIPLVATAYQIYVADTFLVACIGALGLNLLTGYAGQISIGHGGFLGVGAFTSALLATKAGVPFWLSVPAAGALTALVGLLLGCRPCGSKAFI